MARVTLTPDLIQQTYSAIRDATIRTPIIHATRLSMQFGIDLYLKLENLQHTNAFKARGALAKLLTLSDAQKQAGEPDRVYRRRFSSNYAARVAVFRLS